MIRLLIDGQDVALSSDLSIELYMYNPLFDRKSDYTYNISVDLRYPVNARLYKHINRLHVRTKPLYRSAELYDGARLLLRGTEIILSLQDDIAEIQLVSGNSELNYLAASKNMRMRDLNLGTIQSLTTDVAISSLNGSPSTYNYVCAPVAKVWARFGFGYWQNKDYSASHLLNNLSRPFYKDAESKQTNMLNFATTPNLCPQPYLCSVVEKVAYALGYNVNLNELRDNPTFRNLYVVNSKCTTHYNEMIPNWEVNKFLEEIERFCNVVFLVDPVSKSCLITSVDNYYSQESSVTYICKDDVLDNFSRIYDSDPVSNVSYENVSYNVPGHEFFKYGVLDDDVKSACTISSLTDFGKVGTKATEANYNKMDLWWDIKDRTYFVVSRRKNGSSEDIEGNTMFYYVQPVDFIGKRVDESSSENVSFNILPAPQIPVSLYGFYTYEGAVSEGGGSYARCFTMLPYTLDQSSVEEATEEIGLHEFIKDGVPEEAVPDQMFVAYYIGVKPLFFTVPPPSDALNSKLKWPLSLSVDKFVGFGASDSPTYLADPAKTAIYPNSDLSIATLYNKVWANRLRVDTTEEYRLHFRSKSVLDPKNIFIIDNCKFYCRYLKYTLTSQGLSPTIEGAFFLFK